MRAFISFIFVFFTAGAVMADGHTNGEPAAKFDRTTLMVRDIEPSIAFWRDVMGFKPAGEPRVIPAGQADSNLGWDETAERKFTVLYSPDGAGIGLLEVNQDDFPTVDISEHPTGYGGVVLVHPTKNLHVIYERAQAANVEIMKPMAPSATGRSMQMYLKAPTGHVVELYELLPEDQWPK